MVDTTVIITPADLDALKPGIDAGKAAAMITDAIAQAQLAAPCLVDEATLSAAQQAQYKAVLRAAIIRWDDTGSGVSSVQDTVGPFSQSMTFTPTSTRRGLFTTTEIDLLRAICGKHPRGGIARLRPAAGPPQMEAVL